MVQPLAPPSTFASARYVRDIEATAPAPGEFVLLQFGAAAQRAEVFLNGMHLGGHLGGHLDGSTPFSLDATAALQAGRNGLRPMMPDMMPRVVRGQNPRVFYNTGHGHLGWTLSAATADAVTALVSACANA